MNTTIDDKAKEPEVNIGNEKIAKYMGLTQYKQTGAWVNENGALFMVLSYDTSWSEIMPVVEKISKDMSPNPSLSKAIYKLAFYIDDEIRTIGDLHRAIIAYLEYKENAIQHG